MDTANIRGMACAALAGMAVALSVQPVSAELLNATSINTNVIYSVDTTLHTVTPVFSPGGSGLDSLLFDPTGRIIYTELGSGVVNAFNPNTSTNTTLASGLAQPIDLALEPSKTSVLVSDSTSNSLSRVSLAGGVVNTLGVLGRPDGIIYDTTGRLFVNISSGFTVNNSQVEQLDPVTGTILHSSGNTGLFLDGLTYDPATGFLYASDYNNGRIVRIDPTTLLFTILTPTGAPLSQPDGIVSDGLGNLFIASRANSDVMQYNIASNTDTIIGTISGLDDLAPASGLGAPPVPEPTSIALLGTALIGFGLFRRRRRT